MTDRTRTEEAWETGRTDWRTCKVEHAETKHREEGGLWRCVSCGYAEGEDLSGRAAVPEEGERRWTIYHGGLRRDGEPFLVARGPSLDRGESVEVAPVAVPAPREPFERALREGAGLAAIVRANQRLMADGGRKAAVVLERWDSAVAALSSARGDTGGGR